MACENGHLKVGKEVWSPLNAVQVVEELLANGAKLDPLVFDRYLN
jgi:hypothetical protein